MKLKFVFTFFMAFLLLPLSLVFGGNFVEPIPESSCYCNKFPVEHVHAFNSIESNKSLLYKGKLLDKLLRRESPYTIQIQYTLTDQTLNPYKYPVPFI